MIGLTVLVVIAIYIGVFGYVISHARNRGERIAAIVVALAIPFWDLPIGYFNFQRHCSQDGGIHLRKNLPASDAILVDRDLAYTPEQLTRYGFKVIEYEAPGQIVRYTATSSGLTKSNHNAALSTLKVHFNANQMLPWHLVRRDLLISRIDNGEVVARNTDFRWRGLWWQVEMAPLLGDGGRCQVTSDSHVLSAIARGTS